MIKTKWSLFIVASLLLLIGLVNPVVIVAQERYSNFYPQTVWLYGMVNSWGVLGYDLDGKPTNTVAEMVDVFYNRVSQVETATEKQLEAHADLIFYSPGTFVRDVEGRYNALTEPAIIQLFEYARLHTLPRPYISIHLQVPKGYTIEDVSDLIERIWSGKSGYLSRDTLDRYCDRLSLSLDFEPAVFYGHLYLTADDINQLNRVYQANACPERRAALYSPLALPWIKQIPPPKPLYLYDFSNMVNRPAAAAPNVYPIFDGISGRQDTLFTRYQSVVDSWGGRDVGVMVFVFEQLSKAQSGGAFSTGDLASVADWFENNAIDTSVIAFQ